ncbi:hypothetical protein CALCODRAFT_156266 [Calocera cornea HHB12733]|uniref:Uncharacterized protein n=1 Tax=Calocera cornea HHB12733 TaxID=1353952 RepID=A0A165HZ66_9BASI|nr:hypothetical protein CALCODRAFT_156266 [Calocera cornea HHB12733]
MEDKAAVDEDIRAVGQPAVIFWLGAYAEKYACPSSLPLRAIATPSAQPTRPAHGQAARPRVLRQLGDPLPPRPRAHPAAHDVRQGCRSGRSGCYGALGGWGSEGAAHEGAGGALLVCYYRGGDGADRLEGDGQRGHLRAGRAARAVQDRSSPSVQHPGRVSTNRASLQKFTFASEHWYHAPIPAPLLRELGVRFRVLGDYGREEVGPFMSRQEGA